MKYILKTQTWELILLESFHSNTQQLSSNFYKYVQAKKNQIGFEVDQEITLQ